MAYNDPNDPSSPWYQNADWTDPNATSGSGQGIAPPWWSGTGPVPFAPGKTWADAGPQTDPQGNTWTFDGSQWVQQGPSLAGDTRTTQTDPTGGATPPGANTGGPKITDPFNEPFTPPNPVNLGGPAGIPYIPPTPQFKAPGYTPPPAFTPPSIQGVFSDPGYQGRLQQGQTSLQNWAASKGTLADSETGKALTDYGQQQASNEYKNVWDRAVGAYDENYKTQYADPYSIAFQGATAEFAPQMAGYATQAAAGQHANDTNYSNSFQKWLADLGIFQDQRDSTWNKTFQYANT